MGLPLVRVLDDKLDRHAWAVCFNKFAVDLALRSVMKDWLTSGS